MHIFLKHHITALICTAIMYLASQTFVHAAKVSEADKRCVKSVFSAMKTAVNSKNKGHAKAVYNKYFAERLIHSMLRSNKQIRPLSVKQLSVMIDQFIFGILKAVKLPKLSQIRFIRSSKAHRLRRIHGQVSGTSATILLSGRCRVVDINMGGISLVFYTRSAIAKSLRQKR